MSKDIPLPALYDTPQRPGWLRNPEAIREWKRLTKFMMTHQLLNSGNVLTVAHYCALHAKIVAMWLDDTPPIAALLATHRSMAFSLGLLSLAMPPLRDEKPANRFANNAEHKARSA